MVLTLWTLGISDGHALAVVATKLELYAALRNADVNEILLVADVCVSTTKRLGRRAMSGQVQAAPAALRKESVSLGRYLVIHSTFDGPREAVPPASHRRAPTLRLQLPLLDLRHAEGWLHLLPNASLQLQGLQLASASSSSQSATHLPFHALMRALLSAPGPSGGTHTHHGQVSQPLPPRQLITVSRQRCVVTVEVRLRPQELLLADAPQHLLLPSLAPSIALAATAQAASCSGEGTWAAFLLAPIDHGVSAGEGGAPAGGSSQSAAGQLCVQGLGQVPAAVGVAAPGVWSPTAAPQTRGVLRPWRWPWPSWVVQRCMRQQQQRPQHERERPQLEREQQQDKQKRHGDADLDLDSAMQGASSSPSPSSRPGCGGQPHAQQAPRRRVAWSGWGPPGWFRLCGAGGPGHAGECAGGGDTGCRRPGSSGRCGVTGPGGLEGAQTEQAPLAPPASSSGSAWPCLEGAVFVEHGVAALELAAAGEEEGVAAGRSGLGAGGGRDPPLAGSACTGKAGGGDGDASGCDGGISIGNCSRNGASRGGKARGRSRVGVVSTLQPAAAVVVLMLCGTYSAAAAHEGPSSCLGGYGGGGEAVGGCLDRAERQLGEEAGGGGGTQSAAFVVVLAVLLPVAVLLLCALMAVLCMYRRLWRRHNRERGAQRAPGVGPMTTLLITDIANSTALWESLPEEVMDLALKLHHACLRALLQRFNGYESATEGDSFILAFHYPTDAAKFALSAQVQLMDVMWPAEVLAHPDGQEVWVVPRSTEMPYSGSLSAITHANLTTTQPEGPGAGGSTPLSVQRSSGGLAVGGGVRSAELHHQTTGLNPGGGGGGGGALRASWTSRGKSFKMPGVSGMPVRPGTMFGMGRTVDFERTGSASDLDADEFVYTMGRTGSVLASFTSRMSTMLGLVPAAPLGGGTGAGGALVGGAGGTGRASSRMGRFLRISGIKGSGEQRPASLQGYAELAPATRLPASGDQRRNLPGGGGGGGGAGGGLQDPSLPRTALRSKSFGTGLRATSGVRAPGTLRVGSGPTLAGTSAGHSFASAVAVAPAAAAATAPPGPLGGGSFTTGARSLLRQALSFNRRNGGSFRGPSRAAMAAAAANAAAAAGAGTVSNANAATTTTTGTQSPVNLASPSSPAGSRRTGSLPQIPHPGAGWDAGGGGGVAAAGTGSRTLMETVQLSSREASVASGVGVGSLRKSAAGAALGRESVKGGLLRAGLLRLTGRGGVSGASSSGAGAGPIRTMAAAAEAGPTAAAPSSSGGGGGFHRISGDPDRGSGDRSRGSPGLAAATPLPPPHATTATASAGEKSTSRMSSRRLLAPLRSSIVASAEDLPREYRRRHHTSAHGLYGEVIAGVAYGAPAPPRLRSSYDKSGAGGNAGGGLGMGSAHQAAAAAAAYAAAGESVLTTGRLFPSIQGAGSSNATDDARRFSNASVNLVMEALDSTARSSGGAGSLIAPRLPPLPLHGPLAHVVFRSGLLDVSRLGPMGLAATQRERLRRVSAPPEMGAVAAAAAAAGAGAGAPKARAVAGLEERSRGVGEPGASEANGGVRGGPGQDAAAQRAAPPEAAAAAVAGFTDLVLEGGSARDKRTCSRDRPVCVRAAGDVTQGDTDLEGGDADDRDGGGGKADTSAPPTALLVPPRMTNNQLFSAEDSDGGGEVQYGSGALPASGSFMVPAVADGGGGGGGGVGHISDSLPLMHVGVANASSGQLLVLPTTASLGLASPPGSVCSEGAACVGMPRGVPADGAPVSADGGSATAGPAAAVAAAAAPAQYATTTIHRHGSGPEAGGAIHVHGLPVAAAAGRRRSTGAQDLGTRAAASPLSRTMTVGPAVLSPPGGGGSGSLSAALARLMLRSRARDVRVHSTPMARIAVLEGSPGGAGAGAATSPLAPILEPRDFPGRRASHDVLSSSGGAAAAAASADNPVNVITVSSPVNAAAGPGGGGGGRVGAGTSTSAGQLGGSTGVGTGFATGLPYNSRAQSVSRNLVWGGLSRANLLVRQLTKDRGVCVRAARSVTSNSEDVAGLAAGAVGRGSADDGTTVRQVQAAEGVAASAALISSDCEVESGVELSAVGMVTTGALKLLSVASKASQLQSEARGSLGGAGQPSRAGGAASSPDTGGAGGPRQRSRELLSAHAESLDLASQLANLPTATTAAPATAIATTATATRSEDVSVQERSRSPSKAALAPLRAGTLARISPTALHASAPVVPAAPAPPLLMPAPMSGAASRRLSFLGLVQRSRTAERRASIAEYWQTNGPEYQMSWAQPPGSGYPPTGTGALVDCRSWREKCRDEWPPALRPAPPARCAYRGLRVRMGLHTGVTTASDVTFNPTTSHMAYGGTALKVAKAVGDAASGGMILLSQSTFQALVSLMMELPGTPQAVFSGESNLGLGSDAANYSLYQLVHRELVQRIGYAAPLRNIPLTQLGTEDAPTGFCAISFMHVASASMLVAELGQPGVEALQQFKSIATELCSRCGGYVVEASEGLCLAAFRHAAAALVWALASREALAVHPWSAEVRRWYRFALANATYGTARGARGPRPRTGVHVGGVNVEVNAATGRMTYRGKVMNRTSRIAHKATSEQIVCSKEAWDAVEASLQLMVRDIQEERRQAAEAEAAAATTCTSLAVGPEEGGDEDVLSDLGTAAGGPGTLSAGPSGKTLLPTTPRQSSRSSVLGTMAAVVAAAAGSVGGGGGGGGGSRANSAPTSTRGVVAAAGRKSGSPPTSARSAGAADGAAAASAAAAAGSGGDQPQTVSDMAPRLRAASLAASLAASMRAHRSASAKQLSAAAAALTRRVTSFTVRYSAMASDDVATAGPAVPYGVARAVSVSASPLSPPAAVTAPAFVPGRASPRAPGAVIHPSAFASHASAGVSDGAGFPYMNAFPGLLSSGVAALACNPEAGRPRGEGGEEAQPSLGSVTAALAVVAPPPPPQHQSQNQPQKPYSHPQLGTTHAHAAPGPQAGPPSALSGPGAPSIEWMALSRLVGPNIQLPTAKRLDAQYLGSYSLKGVREEMRLFEVFWADEKEEASTGAGGSESGLQDVADRDRELGGSMAAGSSSLAAGNTGRGRSSSAMGFMGRQAAAEVEAVLPVLDADGPGSNPRSTAAAEKGSLVVVSPARLAAAVPVASHFAGPAAGDELYGGNSSRRPTLAQPLSLSLGVAAAVAGQAHGGGAGGGTGGGGGGGGIWPARSGRSDWMTMETGCSLYDDDVADATMPTLEAPTPCLAAAVSVRTEGGREPFGQTMQRPGCLPDRNGGPGVQQLQAGPERFGAAAAAAAGSRPAAGAMATAEVVDGGGRGGGGLDQLPAAPMTTPGLQAAAATIGAAAATAAVAGGGAPAAAVAASAEASSERDVRRWQPLQPRPLFFWPSSEHQTQPQQPQSQQKPAERPDGGGAGGSNPSGSGGGAGSGLEGSNSGNSHRRRALGGSVGVTFAEPVNSGGSVSGSGLSYPSYGSSIRTLHGSSVLALPPAVADAAAPAVAGRSAASPLRRPALPKQSRAESQQHPSQARDLAPARQRPAADPGDARRAIPSGAEAPGEGDGEGEGFTRGPTPGPAWRSNPDAAGRPQSAPAPAQVLAYAGAAAAGGDRALLPRAAAFFPQLGLGLAEDKGGEGEVASGDGDARRGAELPHAAVLRGVGSVVQQRRDLWQELQQGQQQQPHPQQRHPHPHPQGLLRVPQQEPKEACIAPGGRLSVVALPPPPPPLPPPPLAPPLEIEELEGD